MCKWSLQHRPHIVITHHNVIQIGYGVDECPYPFKVDFGSTAPADAPTTEQPGPCLGYTFIKNNAQSRCSGQPPLGRSLSRMTSSQRISTFLLLVPKNSQKSCASVASYPMQHDAQFWISQVMSKKSNSSSLGSIKWIDESSDKSLTVVVIADRWRGGGGKRGIGVVCCVVLHKLMPHMGRENNM
jgi:hypothetical protein